MSLPPQRRYLIANRARFLAQLKVFLRFPSVSSQPVHKPDMNACATWLTCHLRKIGLNAKLHPTKGNPIVVATSSRRLNLPTVLIYGHYDVQPPEPLDLWKTPPFRPVVRAGKLFGRGASDNKGQLFAHIKGVESFLRTGTALPVNVIFLIEGEEETGSDSLTAFVESHARELRADYMVVSDSAMYSKEHPALTYSTRGCVGLDIRVEGPSRDLHSGVFGGSVANPALVLSRLLASCVDQNDHVAIPGFYDGVKLPAAWELRAWKRLPFDANEYRDFLGVPALSGEKGFTPLEQRWARPTFEINGLTSGYQGCGGKTIVPAWASAKLSCRIVPNQNPAAVLRAIERHLRRQCPNSVHLKIVGGHSPWFFTAPDGPGARAALLALKAAFGRKPVFVRDGGTLPILHIFQRRLGAEVLLVGLGLPDDNWHSPNEKIDLANWYRGMQMSAELLARLGLATT